MPSRCIHGFATDQCASCARVRPATKLATSEIPVEEHLGYEIYYVPAVSGWHFRDADAQPSPLSYRSAFLARRAVDEVAASTRG